MAEADCPFCASAGYRSCDYCGGPVFVPVAGERDICAYCREDASRRVELLARR